eukprot:gene144-biopygen892
MGGARGAAGGGEDEEHHRARDAVQGLVLRLESRCLETNSWSPETISQRLGTESWAVDRPEPLLELVRFVHVRERLGGDVGAEELAQRRPPLRHVPLEELPLRHRAAHVGDPLLVRADDVVAVGEAVQPPEQPAEERPGPRPHMNLERDDAPAGTHWEPRERADTPAGTPWEPRERADAPAGTPWEPRERADATAGTPWEPRERADAPAGTPWEPRERSDAAAGTPWEPRERAGAPAGTPWEPRERADAPLLLL